MESQDICVTEYYITNGSVEANRTAFIMYVQIIYINDE